MLTLPRRCIAEALGTFIMVFAGCGAIVVQSATGAITHPGVALTWGLVVLALVYTLGDKSGANMNPAVTLGLALAGRFPWNEVAPYIGAQVVGAFAASGLLLTLFPDDATLGATLPRGTSWQAFVLEIVLTWFLMLSVLCITRGAADRKSTR